MPINEEKFNHMMGQFVTDFGATLHAGMVVIGERLGLYKTMRDIRRWESKYQKR